MAPVHHFTDHPLIHLSDDQDYNCDGCKTSGSGNRFRCHACDFNLHEFCANCPDKLFSFIHHHHHLDLVLHKAPAARCDVCRDSIDGNFYRCKVCDFDAHPICTQLPKELRHVIDDQHSLRLQKKPSGTCAVCKSDCSSLWVYGCESCKVNIHLQCLLQPYVPPRTRSVPPPWSAPPQPWPTGPPLGPPRFTGGGYPWSGLNGGWSSYDNYFNGFGSGGHSYGFGMPYAVAVPICHDYGYDNMNYHQPNEVGNAAAAAAAVGSGGKIGSSMFSLVGRLRVAGVMSSLVLGVPHGFQYVDL